MVMKKIFYVILIIIVIAFAIFYFAPFGQAPGF